mmetsp:Transcript_234/g.523  ORF Transcript_234/g.523 Transcript_234/m.523 type:complete len:91 (-) Transcript_234:607-879(-)
MRFGASNSKRGIPLLEEDALSTMQNSDKNFRVEDLMVESVFFPSPLMGEGGIAGKSKSTCFELVGLALAVTWKSGMSVNRKYSSLGEDRQ